MIMNEFDGHRIWTFLLDRAAEAADRTETDMIRAVLAEHTWRDEHDRSCAGCGYVTVLGNGQHVPRASTLDSCSTLRALAWRFHRHRDWRPQWTLPADLQVSEWPPGENCFCGGAESAVYPHRRGTRRHCRPRRAARREAERAGAVR
jgi:hypothetical protein